MSSSTTTVVIVVTPMAISHSSEVVHRTVMDAFEKTTYYPASPAVGFGTGSRPPLYSVGGGPGPGAYPIKTTMGKLLESNFKSPNQFSLRSRQKFGDPNERSMNKTSALEPGPGSYDLTGRFQSGKDSRDIVFPKGIPARDKAFLGPGPGSYKPLESMGKQVLSTKHGATVPGFSKAERQSMVPSGISDVGPGQYNAPPSACEVQVTSDKPTPASIKFGTGYKKGGGLIKKDLSEPSPGPTSYIITLGGVATKAKGSPYHNSPAATISGRNKFGSPW